MTVAVAPIAQLARDRADRIRSGLETLAPDIIAAWQARDWDTLGYDSWQAYIVGEFGGQLRLGRAERREAVVAMRSEGMSLRAIGSAVGASIGTVHNDVFSFEHPPITPAEETPIDPAPWKELAAVMDTIDELLLRDAPELAAAVQPRRRAATARRLRRLGTGLGRIAWTLEGMDG